MLNDPVLKTMPFQKGFRMFLYGTECITMKNKDQMFGVKFYGKLPGILRGNVFFCAGFRLETFVLNENTP